MALQNITLNIIKQPDSKIINAICKAAENTDWKIRNCSFSPKMGGISFQGNIENLKQDSEFKEILALNSELIQNFSFIFDPNFSISVGRIDNSNIDHISLNFASLPDEQRQKAYFFYSSIRESLRFVDSSKIITSALNEEIKKHYEIRETELSRLENISESIIDRTENFIRKKQEEFNSEKRKLEETYNAKGDLLYDEYKTNQKLLEEERKKLDLKLKEIDDRESKHVRRKIREDLKEELKKRSQKFELTEGTKKLRSPINYFCYVLLFLFGSGFIIYSYLSAIELLSSITNSTQLIALSIKQLTLGLAFGSTAVFFIRWNNKWFEKHSNEEFRLKRHEIDLDRASWLVEMAFEWKTEKGTDIPIELINKLGKNLFEEDKIDEQPLHPSDQLASVILGAASGVSVKIPGGTELNLDRKGLNKLKN